MKFTAQTETISPTQQTLRIEVAIESVSEEFLRVAKQFQGMAQLPGFRTGRAPTAMVETRFAAKIEEEVKRALIPDSFREACREQKLRTIGLPRIEKIEFARNQPLRYEAHVEIVPEFPMPDYKEIVVKLASVNVTDADVENTVKSLQERHAEFTDIAGRSLAMGDFAVIHFDGRCDGKPIVELAPRAKTLSAAKNFWLAMNAETFLPKFCDQLIGANIGEKRQVLVEFPPDFPAKELQGKQGTYSVEIVGIKEKKLPALDDGFARAFDFVSLELLRQRIRTDLVHQREHQAEVDKRNQIIATLCSRVTFELPPSLVASETRNRVNQIVRSLKAQGADDDAISQESDRIMSSAQREAADRVKSQLLLGRIAEAEKIAVSRDELNDRVTSLAAQYRMTPRQLRSQLEENGALEDVAADILVDKVLDFLTKSAKVESPA